MEIIQEVIQWLYPVLYIFLLILAATRARLRAKLWLIAYLAGSVLMSLVWRMPQLLLKLHVLEIETFSNFYDIFGPFMSICNLLVLCLLIPYIIIAPVPKTIAEGKVGSQPPQIPAPITMADGTVGFQLPQEPNTDPSIDPRLSGIGGWLILPAIGLILGLILSFVGIALSLSQVSEIIDEYEGIFVLNLVADFVMTIFLLFAAIVFFGKRKIAPAVMISLMVANIVVCGLLSAINIGADAEIFAIAYGKGLVKGIIGSAIWIPYFCVSKRVKATFVK